MIKGYELYLIICLFFVSAGNAVSQVTSPVNATGNVFAEITPPFTASEKARMNFGKFLPGLLSGEITLSPESTVSVRGGVHLGAGSYKAASFYVTGDSHTSFTISLPQQITLTNSSASKTMKVDRWVSTPRQWTAASKLKDGSQLVYLGATLLVGNLTDSPAGIYSGSYSITFDFN